MNEHEKLVGSNRTIVGLKLLQHFLQRALLHRSNRTIVGLKRAVKGKTPRRWSTQQSHHCGIETKDRPLFRLKHRQQQSHHCGIETVTTANGDW